MERVLVVGPRDTLAMVDDLAPKGFEIVKALQHFNVAQADIDQLVCIYQTSMNDVVSASAAPKEVRPPR